LLNEDDALLLIEMAKKYQIEFRVETFVPSAPRFHDSYITIKDKKLIGMGLRLKKDRAEIPSEISLFKNLSGLTVYLKDIDFNVANTEIKNINGLSLIVRNSNKDAPIKIKGLEYFPNLKGLSITNELVYETDVLFDKSLLNKIKKAYIEFSSTESIENLEGFYLDSCRLNKDPQFLNNSKTLKRLTLRNSELISLPENIFKSLILEVINLEETVLKEAKELPLGIFESPLLEVVKLEGMILKKIPRSIIKKQNIKFFSCEPFLITSEIMEWLKNNELEPFGIKRYKKSLFFNF